jgi:hypothetical protein
MSWRNSEAAERMAERRRREEEAPRLNVTIPTLEKLRLDVEERSASISRPEHTHTRHVVVSSAPALFVMPCRDTQCKDGGHNLTAEILSALRRRVERFEGTDACGGNVGSASCARVLAYVGVASYHN